MPHSTWISEEWGGEELPDSRTWETTVRALVERAQGECELKIPGVCGKGMARILPRCAHHRKLRKQGGRDDLVNLLWTCAGCHRWVHDHPQTSYGEGWLVHSWDDPELIPVGSP